MQFANVTNENLMSNVFASLESHEKGEWDYDKPKSKRLKLLDADKKAFYDRKVKNIQCLFASRYESDKPYYCAISVGSNKTWLRCGHFESLAVGIVVSNLCLIAAFGIDKAKLAPIDMKKYEHHPELIEWIDSPMAGIILTKLSDKIVDNANEVYI